MAALPPNTAAEVLFERYNSNVLEAFGLEKTQNSAACAFVYVGGRWR